MQLIRKFRDRHIEVLRVIVIIEEATVGAVSVFFRILLGRLCLSHFKDLVRQLTSKSGVAEWYIIAAGGTEQVGIAVLQFHPAAHQFSDNEMEKNDVLLACDRCVLQIGAIRG